jgi:ATP-dependent helicase/nuclease subunit A
LDAFLELALNQDGGRYPSLSRFIDEVNAMRRGDDDETPDEGDVEAEAEFDDGLTELDAESEMSEEESHQRVRLMTIHGAKGLEAPFVIMLDTNNTEWRAPHRGVLLDWSPEDASPTHLSLYTSKSLTGARSAIFAAENAVSQNENWNLLYVAMTRAKQGLWMSGVEASNSSGIHERSWYGRALAAGMSVLDIAALDLPEAPSQAAQPVVEVAGAPFKMDHFAIAWDQAKQSHQARIEQIESGTLALSQAEQDEQNEMPDPEILEEGVHFHKLLEFLVPQSSAPHAIMTMPTEQEVINWLGIDLASAQKVLARVQAVLSAPHLQPYLGNTWIQAWNELDIANEAGQSFRLDRLVELEDHLAILDYKLTIPPTDSPMYNKYRSQLQNYQTQLGRIRPDKVNKAYLISAAGQIEQIG